MRLITIRFPLATLLVFGIGGLLVATSARAPAADTQGKKKVAPTKAIVRKSSTASHSKPKAEGVEKEPPTVDILTGMKNGQISVAAEGRSDGRITLSIKNHTDSKLR